MQQQRTKDHNRKNGNFSSRDKIMEEYSFTEARQYLASIFEEAKKENTANTYEPPLGQQA